MRAIPFARRGGPEVLSVREVPQPTPGVGEVLIRTVTSSSDGCAGPARGRRPAGALPPPPPPPALPPPAPRAALSGCRSPGSGHGAPRRRGPPPGPPASAAVPARRGTPGAAERQSGGQAQVDIREEGEGDALPDREHPLLARALGADAAHLGARRAEVVVRVPEQLVLQRAADVPRGCRPSRPATGPGGRSPG